MQWPLDADGDVFRRMQSRGFDFGTTCIVDFSIDFSSWPPSEVAIQLLDQHFPGKTEVFADDDSRGGYINVQIIHQLTYEWVLEIQNQITELMLPFEGVCESWGVLHD